MLQLFDFCQSNGCKVIITVMLTLTSLESSESEHFMILKDTNSYIGRDLYKDMLQCLPRLDKFKTKRILTDLPGSHSSSLAHLN